MSFTQQSCSDAAPPTRQHLEVIRQHGKKYSSDYTSDGPLTTDGGENSSVVEATAAPEGAAAGGGAVVPWTAQQILQSFHDHPELLDKWLLGRGKTDSRIKTVSEALGCEVPAV